MGLRSFSILRNVFAAVVCAGLLAGTAACGAADAKRTAAPTSHSPGAVAIFTPSDGITLSQYTPLNKWAKLVPEITQQLEDLGFSSDNISTYKDTSLDKQSQDIQDYVVNIASGNKASSGSDADDTTLIVAPCTSTDKTVAQYGDYVTTTETASGDDDAVASERLSSALELAEKSGMHVIVLSNDISGVTPDALVRMSTASMIGQLQAKQLVNKLQLDSASASKPKTIEILLPVSASSDDGGNGSTQFAKEAFSGMWKVLGPYFRSGAAVTASDTLNAKTTGSSWSSVAFTATGDDDIKQELTARLKNDGSSSPAHVDGIIAMNDYVASVAVDELTALGYEGSAADINPSISIMGIVGSLSGHKDLTKSAVPAPQGADSGGNTSENDTVLSWPVITGYGAYTAMLPDIVNGKQWMTALEDRQGIAKDIAQAAKRLSTGGSLASMSSVSNKTINGKTIPVITGKLVAVNASNLKAKLIDPGYVTLADAGL
ncbi:hypothetical protein [Bifidobacterium thermophilum]|uniref:hypothetical protein n=1 Tax=Bifidobacterium thermophilum TaxID=33905 RepID=UPI0030B1730C